MGKGSPLAQDRTSRDGFPSVTSRAASDTFDQGFWFRIRPRCVRAFLRAVRPLPPAALDPLLGGVGLVHGLVRPSRLCRARTWAATHAAGRVPRWRLALTLLRNHGRSLVVRSFPALETPEAFRNRVTLIGAERLEEAARRGGTILLSFHLGPGGTWPILEAFGYAVIYAGADPMERAFLPPRSEWRRILARRPPAVLLRDPRTRVAVLYHARQLLLQGASLSIAADGSVGPALLTVPVPGGVARIDRGWFVLRRHSGATVLPVLTYWRGSKVVLTIHPPLPAPHDDPQHDLAACREVLRDLLTDYVRTFPEQCYSLGLQAPESAPSTMA